MYLSSVSGKGVVGLSFTHKLGPVAMIIGPNASGKTAILRAIRLALLGYEPGIGEKNDKIFQLSGGDSMEVAVMTDDGKVFDRQWRLVGGSVRANRKGLTPNLPQIPVVLLDPSEYFSLSAEKRTDYVFNRVKIDAGKFSIKTLLKRLKALETPTAAHQAAMTVCMNDLDFASQDANLSVQDVLQGEIRSLTETMQVQRAALDRMTKTLAGMTELDLKGAGQLSESLPSLNTKIAELEKELQELSLQRDRLEQLKGRIKGDPVQESIALQTKINELEAKLESQVLLPDPSEALGQALTTVQRIRTDTAYAEKELSRLIGQSHAEQTKQRQKRTWQTEVLSYHEFTSVIPDLQRQIEKLKPSVEGYKPKLADADKALLLIHNEMGGINHDLDARGAQIAKLERDLDAFLAQDQCPTCRANTPGWQDNYKDGVGKEVESLQQTLNRLEASMKGAVERETVAKKALELALSEDNEHKTRQTTLHSRQKRLQEAQLAQNKVERLQSAIDALGAIQDYSEAIAECEKNLKELGEKTAAAEGKVGELEQAKGRFNLQDTERKQIAMAINSLQLQSASLGSIIEEIKSLPGGQPVDLPARIQMLDELRTTKGVLLSALFKAKDLALASQQDVERHKQAEQERDKAEAEFEVLKLVRDTVKEFLGEIVAAAWGPILAVANRIAGPLLKTPLSVHENILGRWHETIKDKFVTTDTFSGEEGAATFVGMCLALASDSPFKLVLADNNYMREMDADNKRKFIGLIMDLQKRGELDQFVGIDLEKDCYVRGVKTHEDGTVSTKPLEGLTLIKL